MPFTNRRKTFLTLLLILVGLIFPSSFSGSSATSAQSNPAFIGEVRPLEVDQAGIQNPAGLAFSRRANAFHVMEQRSMRPAVNTDLIKMTSFADRAGSARVAASI